MLLARPAMRFLSQRLFERGGHPVEDGHGGKAMRPAHILKPRPRIGIHQCEQHQARIGLELGHDPVKMLAAPDHGPEMAHHIGIVELGKRRFRQHFQRFAGAVGKQVKVDTVGDGILAGGLWTGMG